MEKRNSKCEHEQTASVNTSKQVACIARATQEWLAVTCNRNTSVTSGFESTYSSYYSLYYM